MAAPARSGPRPPASEPSLAGRALRILALAAVGGGLVVGGYWWVEIRPRLQSLDGQPTARASSDEVDVLPGAVPDADATVQLDVDPMGIAWDGSALRLGSRKGGLLRIVPQGDEWEVEMRPVSEPTYGQNVAFDSVAWNGREIVGLAMGAWFQHAVPQVLVVVDPATGTPGRIVPVGDDVGAITWDGTGYWIATRKDTTDEDVPKILRYLDASFAEVRTIAAPASGCQGLAWDGASLWWADVFDDQLLRLDVSGDEAVVLDRHDVGRNYLSGVAWDGRTLWIADYEDPPGLHRLAPATVAAWRGGAEAQPPGGSDDREDRPYQRISDDDAEVLLASVRKGSFEAPDAAVALATAGRADEARTVLRDLLFSEDTFQRMHAEHALDAMGFPADRARRVERHPETGPEDTDLLELRAWFEGDELHASWTVHVGEELLAGTQRAAPDGIISMPTFANYQIDVSGGTLPQEQEIEIAAEPGLNVVEDRILASGLGPGEYNVSVFIHVQYVTASGGNQILNDNAGFVTLER